MTIRHSVRAGGCRGRRFEIASRVQDSALLAMICLPSEKKCGLAADEAHSSGQTFSAFTLLSTLQPGVAVPEYAEQGGRLSQGGFIAAFPISMCKQVSTAHKAVAESRIRTLPKGRLLTALPLPIPRIGLTG